MDHPSIQYFAHSSCERRGGIISSALVILYSYDSRVKRSKRCATRIARAPMTPLPAYDPQRRLPRKPLEVATAAQLVHVPLTRAQTRRFIIGVVRV